MNILNKLTLRNLKLNKKRTIVTIIGISLSVGLICSITTFVSSFQNSLQNRAIQTDGNYHIELNNVPKDKQKYYINNVKVKHSMVSQDVGYVKLENSKNEYKPYAFIEEVDDKIFNNMPIKLIEGRLPQNDTEIVISNHISTNGQVKINIGDVLNWNIGQRKLIGLDEILTQSNPIYMDDNNNIKEEFVVKDKKTYKVVGIIERSKLESYSAPGYLVLSKLSEEPKDVATIRLLLNNPNDAYKLGEEISQNIDENSQMTVNYNNELLRFSGVVKRNETTGVLIIMSCIVIGIIMFTSIFVIKNSFNISITERLKQYGMLTSIGATSKQIKKNVLFEGLILALISIPLGIIIGILAIWIVISIVSNLLSGIITGFTLQLTVSIWAILIAFIVSTVTIYISVIIPARRASRISPIDAIRENNDIKIGRKKFKTNKLFYKLFGIEGDIANKNLKRSRKKYRTTIFSIFLSIVMFISMSAVIKYGFKISSLFYKEMGYNIIVNGYRDDFESLEDKQTYFNKILKLDNIEKYTIAKNVNGWYNFEKFGTEKSKTILNSNNLSQASLNIIAVGEASYKEYLKELGLKYENANDKAILVDNSLYIEEGGLRVEYNYLNIKEKDKFIFTTYDQKGKENIPTELEIITRTTKLPLGINENGGVILIVSDKEMENHKYSVNNMYIKSNNTSKLVEEIAKVDTTKKDNVINYEENAKEENSMVLAISIFLYGFIAVISIIGITNIFNTITTNMALRNREFAILKSIGMTNKEFKKMINFESILYGLKALLFGLPVGIAISYCIYTVMGNAYVIPYELPLNEIIISIVFVFAIIFITMRYSTNKTKNQNIIETIRNENL